MDKEHYTVMSRLIDGFNSMNQEGLCTSGAVEEDEDVEDEEETENYEGRDDIVSVLSPREDDDCSQADKEEEEQAVDKEDIHMAKVLRILDQEEDEESIESIRVWGDADEESIRSAATSE